MRMFIFVKIDRVTFLYETNLKTALDLIRKYRRILNIGIVSASKINDIIITRPEFHTIKVVNKFQDIPIDFG